MDSPGFKPWWGQDFLHMSRLDMRPTQFPVRWLLGLFPRSKSSQTIAVTIHRLLAPMFCMSRAISLPLLCVFKAYYRLVFTLIFLHKLKKNSWKVHFNLQHTCFCFYKFQQFSFLVGCFSLLRTIQTGNRALPPTYTMGIRSPFTEVMWQGHETDHSPQCHAKYKKGCSYFSTPSYAFIARTRITLPVSTGWIMQVRN